MDYFVTQTDWQSDGNALMSIRERVFMQEQNISLADELDGKDETAIHFLTRAKGLEPVACARLLIEHNAYHIGRVAVLAEYRQQHIGTQLMEFILKWCQAQRADLRIYLHAQTNRIKFYERLGFTQQGNVFLDAGIPHIEMWHKQLGAK